MRDINCTKEVVVKRIETIKKSLEVLQVTVKDSEDIEELFDSIHDVNSKFYGIIEDIRHTKEHFQKIAEKIEEEI